MDYDWLEVFISEYSFLCLALNLSVQTNILIDFFFLEAYSWTMVILCNLHFYFKSVFVYTISSLILLGL